MDAHANDAMSYVVLSPSLNSSDSARFATYFTAFATGYERAFTGDLAKSPQQWRSTIFGEKLAPQPLMRIVVAIKHVGDEEIVIGGIAAEYYRSAECALLTYLFVRESERRHGHARKLIEKASEAFAALGNVRAVLAEAEWPDLLPAAGFDQSEIAEARQRLYFFSEIGARLVDIDYVQPALGKEMNPVVYLRLLLLPFHSPGGHIPRPGELPLVICSFLGEFYEALAQSGGLGLDMATLDRLQSQANTRGPRLCVAAG
jgi:GNAT superfamily N-acetyltransferase